RSYGVPFASLSTSTGATLPRGNAPSDAVVRITSRFTSALQITKAISSAMTGGLTGRARYAADQRPVKPSPDRSGSREQDGAVGIARRRGDEHERGVGHLTRRGPAELAHRLVPVVEAVDERFGELAAVRVHRQAPVGAAQTSVLDERAALAVAAEAPVLEREQHHRREVVVEHRGVDVRR